MAQSILTAGSEELIRARDMLAEYQELRASVEELRGEKTKADRALQTEERAVADQINTTVKKRKADLENGFNREIQKEQSALKKVRNAREKAKNKGVAERISEETSELREKNRTLHAAVRSVFKQKGLPRFCDSKVYYALYMPDRISDFVICLVFLALFAVFLPGVCACFAAEMWQRVVIFAAFWLVEGGIYALVYRLTKGKNRAVLVDMKDSRKEILKNEKEIRRIKRAIRADKSDDLYGLENYDEKIRSHEDMINQLTDRKNIVMMDFETNTKKVIADEITAQNAEHLRELRETDAEAGERFAELAAREKSLSSDLASNYQAYLGLEYMDVSRLQELIDLIDCGRAATVKEAMDVREMQEKEKRDAAGAPGADAAQNFAENETKTGNLTASNRKDAKTEGEIPNLDDGEKNDIRIPDGAEEKIPAPDDRKPEEK